MKDVDMTLIEEQLKLTFEERLKRLEEFEEFRRRAASGDGSVLVTRSRVNWCGICSGWRGCRACARLASKYPKTFTLSSTAVSIT